MQPHHTLTTGHKVTVLGAAVILVCFFLPWVSIYWSEPPAVWELGGWQLATGTRVQTGATVQIVPSFAFLFFLPLVTLVVLAVVYGAWKRGYSTRTDSFALIGLGTLSFIVLFLQLAQGRAQETNVRWVKDVQTQLGLWGVVLGHFAVVAGGIIDLPRKRNVVLAVVLLIPILFCLLGSAAGYMYATQEGVWVRIGEPPSKAVHIISLNGGDTLVQTDDGQIYRSNGFSPWQKTTFAMPAEPVTRVLFSRDYQIYVQTTSGRVYACSGKECASEGTVVPSGEIVEVWHKYFRMANGQVYTCGPEWCQPEDWVPPDFREALKEVPPSPNGRVIEQKVVTRSVADYFTWSAVLLMEDGSLWYSHTDRIHFLDSTVRGILQCLIVFAVGVAIALAVAFLAAIGWLVGRIRNQQTASSARIGG